MAKKKNIDLRHTIFIGLIVLILVVMSLTIYFTLKTNIVEEVLKSDQIIKLLLVIEDDEKPVSTTVLAYYPATNRGTIIDIPGNTGGIYKTIDRSDRIDAIYEEKGIDSYRSEIETLLDMTIPFSLEISLDDFAVLSDLFGGMEISVQSPIDEVVDDTYFLVPSGQVRLDGDKILRYITYRGEFEQPDAQQIRIQNTVVAFYKALNENASKIFANDFFSYYAKYIKANIATDDLSNLLNTISKIDAERLFPQVVTGSERNVDGEILLFPYNSGHLVKEVMKQTISALISDTTFARVYSLEIQNGTDVQGLASNTASLLRSTGYDVSSIVNADKNDYEETFIINHIGNDEIAQALGEFIHCTNIITPEIDEAVSDSERLIDYTIVLGTDFDGRYVR